MALFIAYIPKKEIQEISLLAILLYLGYGSFLVRYSHTVKYIDNAEV